MKKQMSSSNKTKKALITVFLLSVAILLLTLMGTKNKKVKENPVSIYDAQTMCMLMEQADLVNLMGESLNSATAKKAENTCLSQWDLSKNIENTEDKFIEATISDWQERKKEYLGEYTLEEIYNESKEINTN